MKYKEFLSKLKKDGKITAAEFDAAIESAPDADFPDAAVPHFENAFLTVDRASTHKDVHGKIKRESLDPVDNDIKKLLSVIDQHDKFKASEIDRMGSTYEKIAAIRDFFPELINKVKAAPAGGDEELKKKLKTFEETNQDLLSRLEKAQQDFTTEKTNLEKDWQKKFHDHQVDTYLEKYSNKYTLAEGYDKTRDAITKVILSDLKSKNSLSLGEKDGQTILNVLDKEGKPRFNGNTPITIENLLDEAWKPFIKVNNSGENNNGQQQQTQVTNQFKVPDNNSTTRRQGARTTVS